MTNETPKYRIITEIDPDNADIWYHLQVSYPALPMVIANRKINASEGEPISEISWGNVTKSTHYNDVLLALEVVALDQINYYNEEGKPIKDYKEA